MRRWFRYDELEENTAGMWAIVTGEKKQENMARAADLMRCPDEFAEAMREAVHEWPNSAEFNLSNANINRIAWLGHAGCFVSTGSPEENTRCAWHTLSKEEQDMANMAAQTVLEEWLSVNAGNDYPLLWIMERNDA